MNFLKKIIFYIFTMVLKKPALILSSICFLFLTISPGSAQIKTNSPGPEAELHLARMIYGNADNSRRGFGGFGRPWWAIDWPDAEYHFTRGVRRLTTISIADDSQHLRLTDDEIFDYPWLFVQQVGTWSLSLEETARLREYLDRGGFLLADDFHGGYEWDVFMSAIRHVFPNKPVIDIPLEDEVLHVLYDLDKFTQIPGRRHLRQSASGEIVGRLAGPPHWRGIYDDNNRLIVAINYNMDMGDAWEHADDPIYPEPMTALAYRFGINYLIYAMTH